MKKTLFLTLASSLMVISLVKADPALPPGKWWRRPEIVQELALSDAQQEKLDAIFRKAAGDLIDLRGAVEKGNIALRGLLDQSDLDGTAIHQEAARLSEAKSRLFDRELSMLVDMRGVLSNAQWKQMRNQLDRLARPQQWQPPPMLRRNRRP